MAKEENDKPAKQEKVDRPEKQEKKDRKDKKKGAKGAEGLPIAEVAKARGDKAARLRDRYAKEAIPALMKDAFPF